MFLTTMQLVIFDVDGTLVRTKSGDTFRRTPDDWGFIPGRKEAVMALSLSGPFVALATNQGGAAFGYFKVSDMGNELRRTATELGLGEFRRGYAQNSGVYVCYTHPGGTEPSLTKDEGAPIFKKLPNRRKPGPGMLLEAMRDYQAEPAYTLMVGDRDEDKGAAEAAGCQFMWADEFFGVCK